MKTTTKITVRAYELDSYNHVNNANYLHYLEHARMDFMNQIGFDFKKCTELGYSLYTTHIDIQYKVSAFLNDELTITSEMTKLGAVSGTVHQEITKADRTLCTVADVTWASVKDGRPSKLPEELLTCLKK